MAPRSRAKPPELRMRRGRPPLEGTSERKEWDSHNARVKALRDGSSTSNGLPRVRRGAPPRDPDARKVWENQNALARELRQSSGAILVPGKTPRIFTATPVVETSESDAEILARHKASFENLIELTHSVATGDLRALIVSGGPGIGKTVASQDVLNHHKTKNGIRYKKISGRVTAAMLYKIAYKYRGPKDRLLIDDADRLFFEEDGLNLLKALLDTLDKREPSWNTSTALFDEEGHEVPRSGWEYEGAIIFNSNLDFDRIINGPPSKLSDHLRAVVNRALYFDLRMHSPRELYIWTKYMVETKGILMNKHHLSKAQQTMALKWIEENLPKLREVSIRTALSVGFLLWKHTKKWQSLAQSTLFVKGPRSMLPS